MEDNAAYLLVVIGATPEGRKELVGFKVGVRESAQSWRELLVDLAQVEGRYSVAITRCRRQIYRRRCRQKHAGEKRRLIHPVAQLRT